MDEYNNGIYPGFSRKANDPEILAGVKKYGRVVRIIFIIAILLPLLICGVLSKVKDSFTLFAIGIFLSSVFLAAFLVREIKRVSRKGFDGVVLDKFSKTKSYGSPDDTHSQRSDVTRYYLKLRTDDGRELTQALESRLFYDYLNVNDRVRFHPKLNGYFEKYDKSGDSYLICPACLRQNSPVRSRCEGCGVPLLK